MKTRFLVLVLIIAGISPSFPQKKSPSFEEVLSLRSVSYPQISPDGRHVVFQKSAVDWKNNRYDRELWISRDGAKPIQLTNNGDGSSSGAQWTPDGRWISFTSDRSEKNQVWIIRPDGGESFQVTHEERSPSSYRWSPSGDRLAFLMSVNKEEADEEREELYGKYAVEDQEYAFNQLYILDFDRDLIGHMPLPSQLEDSVYKSELKAKLHMDSVDFTITGFRWSPDGEKIAFNHQPNPLINSWFKSDVSVYDIESETYELLVSNPGSDRMICWSPDGKSIVYNTDLDDTTSNYYRNRYVFKMDIGSKKVTQLGPDWDEWIRSIEWTASGLFATSWQKTKQVFLKINEKDGQIKILEDNLYRFYRYSFSEDGKHLTYTGDNEDGLGEVYKDTYPLGNPVRITSSTGQIADWLVTDASMISWKSKDGTIIEGVLHKPQDYDPDQKYPLLVVIHGGPTGISTPYPAASYVYPIVQWVNKGALVLEPNYRGSAGYGEAFRSLNVKNLGVGDTWDVKSGVDHLIEQGMVDPGKVGAMGWSQGGYISAFLTTYSDKFSAISVGAGIANWMTYYVNTDIHPFTRQYLKATPWSDKEIYEKTSPMTYINNASTPTLIQHGEFDRRVPPANAFELYQGLQDVGVETKLIIYKGFGHGITKPKERLAGVWHNWQWFGKYIWGEEIEIPMEK